MMTVHPLGSQTGLMPVTDPTLDQPEPYPVADEAIRMRRAFGRVVT